MISLIRLGTSKDAKFFDNVIFFDEEARISLNYKGGGLEFTNDTYNFCLVAEVDLAENQEVAGFIKVSLHCNSGKIYIDSLFIRKKYRKMGVGKRLLDEACNRARSSWVASKIYTLTIENEAMEYLLKKSSFHCIGTYKGFVLRGVKSFDQSCWEDR